MDCVSASFGSGAAAEPSELPSLTISAQHDADGKLVLYANGELTTKEQLADLFKTIGIPPADQPVTLTADRTLPYAEVSSVMDMLHAIGVRKIAVDTRAVVQVTPGAETVGIIVEEPDEAATAEAPAGGQAAADSPASPTHKQSSLVNINPEGMPTASVQCFCLTKDNAAAGRVHGRRERNPRVRCRG